MQKCSSYYLLAVLIFVVNLHWSTSIPQPSNLPLTAAEKEQFLDVHNYLRYALASGKLLPYLPSAADMSYMYWNDLLAARAYNDAKRCNFAITHFSIPGTFSTVGQNLGVQSSSTPKDFVYAWFVQHRKSVSGYQYGLLNTTDPKFGLYGVFTQVAWSTAKYLGCGRNYCSNLGGYLVYCNYAPAGNYNKVYPYIAGIPCSRCKPDAPLCYNGLCISAATCSANGFVCTCQNKCNNGGILDPVTCTCKNCPSQLISYFCDEPCLDTRNYCPLPAFKCPTSVYYPYCPHKCNVTALICTPPITAIQNTNVDNIVTLDVTINVIGSTPDITDPIHNN